MSSTLIICRWTHLLDDVKRVFEPYGTCVCEDFRRGYKVKYEESSNALKAFEQLSDTKVNSFGYDYPLTIGFENSVKENELIMGGNSTLSVESSQRYHQIDSLHKLFSKYGPLTLCDGEKGHYIVEFAYPSDAKPFVS